MFTKQSILFTILILIMLMLSSVSGQTRYSNYSMNPLTLYELALVGKLLPKVAEQNEIIQSYKDEIGLLRTVISINEQEISQLNFTVAGLKRILDDSKAKWWQSPVAIVAYVVLSFVVGVMVAL